MIRNLFTSYWYSFIKYEWEEILFEILIVLLILFVGTLALKLVGKKSISQMTMPNVVFLFILTTTLGGLIINPRALFIALIIIVTIIFALKFIEKLQFRYEFIEEIFVGKPVLLLENGIINEKALKKNRISLAQLKTQLRLEGIEAIEFCKTITLEPNGKIGIELKDEYHPLRKIYFDEAMKQILEAINKLEYKEVEIQPINNIFFEIQRKSHNIKK